MEKRFKREKNLSHHTQKIKASPRIEEQEDVHEHTDVTPLEHISEVYVKIQNRRSLRDSILL